MKVPGSAWLQFETLPEQGGTLLVQTAYFAPQGLAGLALLVRALPCPRRDLLGYDCRAGRRGRRAGARRGARVHPERVRPPNRRGALCGLDALLRRRGCLTGPSPRRATTTNPFQSVTDFFRSPTWHFLTYHLRLLPRRALARLRLLGLQGRAAADRRQDRPRGVRAHRPRVRTARPHHLRHRAAARVPRTTSASASSRCSMMEQRLERGVALLVLQDAGPRRLPGVPHLRAPAAHHVPLVPPPDRAAVARLPVLRGGRARRARPLRRV